MIRKITNAEKYGNGPISILLPGNVIDSSDSGIGSIGRIDQAKIERGVTIKMHPHSNDEILSYFRTGTAIHTDSEHYTETISRKKLMLMKAGKVFYHEEHVSDQLEGLQIFIRPKTKDYAPKVIFYDLEDENSINEWRLLASQDAEAPIQFTSETAIYDMQINNEKSFETPITDLENRISILYVFQGEIVVDNDLMLTKGECVVFDEEKIAFKTNSTAELVLFATNKNQDCYKNGMFSGNTNN